MRAGYRAAKSMENFGVPTPWTQAEGHTHRVASARREGTPRGLRPRARTEAPRAGTGRSHVRLWQERSQAAPGSLRTHAGDERTWEVGRPRSTWEAAEQSRETGRGGGGGKGGRPRGTCTSATRSGHRAGEARQARSSGYVRPPGIVSCGPASSPKVGAGCGNPARPDLCGGRRVTGVPTAT